MCDCTVQNEVSAAEIEDLDLENFDDFEEMESELQDAQRQWTDEAQRPREEEEEMIRAEEEAATRPHQVSRTVEQKWRPPSRDPVPEDIPAGLVKPVCVAGPSSVRPSHRESSSSRVPPSTEHGTLPTDSTLPRTPERGRAQSRDTVSSGAAKKMAVVPARPLTVGGDHSRRGRGVNVISLSGLGGGGAVVVARLSQTADIWTSNPLVRIKVYFAFRATYIVHMDSYLQTMIKHSAD